ncbi:uncharacterized protein PgNI_07662, partial [Pyricularia grisea]|uniref:Uncharacterized protein n=1 Tax=Pyricularia grisea TaxID=148305 RepID=A0A6P8B243_PYRGI
PSRNKEPPRTAARPYLRVTAAFSFYCSQGYLFFTQPPFLQATIIQAKKTCQRTTIFLTIPVTQSQPSTGRRGLQSFNNPCGKWAICVSGCGRSADGHKQSSGGCARLKSRNTAVAS